MTTTWPKVNQSIVSPKGREYRVVSIEPLMAYMVVRYRAGREFHTAAPPAVTAIDHWMDSPQGTVERFFPFRERTP
ncbi:MAG: hypothetical protein O7D91_19635 [Planctomycetota bacterium]|nr:hypothetical protein [Planctomycetota bacterium]